MSDCQEPVPGLLRGLIGRAELTRDEFLENK